MIPKFTEEDKALVAAKREKGREGMGIKTVARRFEGEIVEVCSHLRSCVCACVRRLILHRICRCRPLLCWNLSNVDGGFVVPFVVDCCASVHPLLHS